MPKKRFTVEQIIHHFREADVRLAKGKTVGDVCRRIGVSRQSYHLYGRLSRCKLYWLREVESPTMLSG